MKRFFYLSATLLLLAGCNPSNQTTAKTSDKPAKGSDSPVISPTSEPTGTTPEKQSNSLDQSVLRASAEQLNRSVPKKIDEETVLTKVEAQKDGLLYNYELINKVSTDLDSDTIGILRGTVKDKICTTAETKSFLKEGYSYYYSYVGKDQKPVTKFSVAPKDCGI